MLDANPFDAEITRSEQRIARQVAHLARLDGHPDARPAREMLGKLLESERNFKAGLEARRETARTARSRNRFKGRALTWPMALLAVAVLAATLLLHLHGPH